MNNFFQSFSPLLKKIKIKKYLFEILLLGTAVILTVISMVIYLENNQADDGQEIVTTNHSDKVLSEKIFVDISGAVKSPDLYEMKFGARLKDIIKVAGGLSNDADKIFFNRNFNLARIIVDQEKIYVPSMTEINNGIFTENPRTLDYTSPNIFANSASVSTQTNDKINLNNATVEELDQLPGVGKATADKIINNRPYSTIDDLLTKKSVNKGLFDKIKALITL